MIHRNHWRQQKHYTLFYQDYSNSLLPQDCPELICQCLTKAQMANWITIVPAFPAPCWPAHALLRVQLCLSTVTSRLSSLWDNATVQIRSQHSEVYQVYYAKWQMIIFFLRDKETREALSYIFMSALHTRACARAWATKLCQGQGVVPCLETVLMLYCEYPEKWDQATPVKYLLHWLPGWF